MGGLVKMVGNRDSFGYSDQVLRLDGFCDLMECDRTGFGVVPDISEYFSFVFVANIGVLDPTVQTCGSRGEIP